MKLEPLVVFFPPNLAISPALNRVSKTEAVMMSHDPAKNNSSALTWLPPCQAGQVPRLWGARAWRPAGWPKPPKDPPRCSLLSPHGSLNLPLQTAHHTAAFPPRERPDLAIAPPSSLLLSHSESPDPGPHRRLGTESTQAQTALSCVPVCK